MQLLLKHISISFFAFFVFTKNNFAQVSSAAFKQYTRKEGLTHNNISSLVQDERGYIWAGTSYGVNRFDGTHFKHFSTEEVNAPLPGNLIANIRKSAAGQLLVCTEAGVQLINTNFLQTQNLIIPSDTSLYYWSNFAVDAAPAGDGTITVLTKTGFFVFSQTGKLIQRYDHYSAGDAGKAWMLFGSKLFKMNNGNVIAETEMGFIYYDAALKKIITDKTNSGMYAALKQENTSSGNLVFKDDKDRFIICDIKQNLLRITNNEVRLLNVISLPFNAKNELGWRSRIIQLSDSLFALTGHNSGYHLIHINPVSGKIIFSGKLFPGYLCNTLLLDKNNRLWIGTNEGLFRQQLQAASIYSFKPILTSKNSNRKYAINTIYFTGDEIYAGCNDNMGILVFDKKTFAVKKQILLPQPKQAKRTSVYSFLKLGPDKLYFGTDFGMLKLNIQTGQVGPVTDKSLPDFFHTTAVYLSYTDKSGITWLATGAINTILFYDSAKGQFGVMEQNDVQHPMLNINAVFNITEDKDGNIWFSGDGLTRWNKSKNEFDTLIKKFSGANTLSRAMNGAAVDNKNNLWVSSSPGITLFNVSNNTTSRFTTGEGLPSNTLNYFNSPLPGFITSSSHNGVSITDINSSTIRTYDEDDGLPDATHSSPFFHDPYTNEIYFARQNIICRIPLSEFSGQHNAPAFFIEYVSDGKTGMVPYPEKEISCNYKQNNITIKTAAIEFEKTGNLAYAFHIIHKNDTSFFPYSSQEYLNLYNMAPGKYTVIASLKSSNNEWPVQSKTLLLTIHPPFWKTRWFMMLAGVLLIACFYMLYRYRIKSVKKKAELDKRLAEFELKALHAQMNPHFIFNCLNGIKKMILNNEQQTASRYLSKFAKLIRLTLDQSKQNLITLKQNNDYLSSYLEMESLRFDKSFSYSIQVDAAVNADELLVPSLMIQPLVENAIWHGLMTVDGEKKLDISYTGNGKYLICKIEDNGRGISFFQSRADTYQTGINNIKQRLQLINEKMNSLCTLELINKKELDKNAQGTIAILTLPLIKDE